MKVRIRIYFHTFTAILRNNLLFTWRLIFKVISPEDMPVFSGFSFFVMYLFYLSIGNPI